MGDQPVVGVTGRVLVAPLGTAFPAGPAVEYSAGWRDLGLVTPDGATITAGSDKETFGAWSLFGPARVSITGRRLHIAYQLENWSSDTVPFAFGGGDVDTVTGGFEYTPPAGGETDFRAMALSVEDGDIVYRWHVFKGMAADDVETVLQKASLAVLPIGFDVFWPSDSSAPWKFQTSDPDFEAGFLSS